MSPDLLERLRDRTYRRTRARRVRTMQDAARFIDDTGFCLLFASTQSIEMPSLFEAVKGRRDVHIDDWDEDSERVWVWKNDLPASRRAYYGKVLAGGKPVFVSLEMLPYLYAMTALANVNTAYRQGRLSHEAKRVHDALRDRGPTPVLALRTAVGLDRSSDTPRFHRALDELQRALVILPVGAVVERGAWPSQIFELVARWFPKQIARAERIGIDAARRAVIARYVETVIAAKPAMIARIFGLSREAVTGTVDDLMRRKICTQRDGWIFAHARSQ